MSQAISFRRNDADSNAHHAGSVSSSFKADLGLSPRWRASPMSFKMGSLVGSLGSRVNLAPGCSPTPALDSHDFKMNTVSSSFDHSRFLQALSTSHANEEGESNYTCCGLPLNDLHALLDHFEESHVYVVDHQSLMPQQPHPLAQQAIGAIPAYDDMTLGAMEMNDIELDSTDSPLGSGSSTASSQNSSPHMGSQAALSANSSMYPYANLMASNGTGMPTSMAPNGIAFADVVGTSSTNPASNLSVQLQQAAQCIPPSLLFSPVDSPGSSRPESSAGIAPSATTTPDPTAPTATTADTETASDGPKTPTLEVPPAPISTPGGTATKAKVSPILTEFDENVPVVSGPGIVHPGPPPPTQAPTSFNKPFKCPTPHCNKSYKQANGLKYHMTHGQCCFLPKDPALEGLDELEKDRIERPFGCGVGGCERRYKNMNGLRYHYQHSGAHGAVGLALLAAGTHSVQIAAHNAALGRSSSKAAAAARAAAGNGVKASTPAPGGHSRQSSVSSPTSSTGSGVSRASSVMSTMSVSTVKGGQPAPSSTSSTSSSVSPSRGASGSSTPLSPRVATSSTASGSTRPAQPQTYAQTAAASYYQQPGYPYLPQPGAGYPYLPSTSTTSAQANRGPVFPPTTTPMANTIAAMAGAFGNASTPASASAATPQLGAPFAYQASQAQRPHQLLRTNSQGHGAGAAPVVATSAVTAVSGGSPHAISEDIEMEVDEN